MKVDISCLQGDIDHLSRAKTLAVIKDFEVNSPDEIITQIARIYKEPNCPYPRIGTTVATSEGFIVPSIGDCFFWVTISNEGVLILDDFGSGPDRLQKFYGICAQSASQCQSIWEFANKWSNTHHKSSIERLVTSYIHHVCSTTPSSRYVNWLGAKSVYEQTQNGKIYFGINLSYIDTTSNITCICHDYIWHNFIKKNNDKFEEAFVKEIVTQYFKYQGIDKNTNVSEKPNDISQKDFSLICNDFANLLKKMFKTKQAKEEFLKGEIPHKKVFKGVTFVR